MRSARAQSVPRGTMRPPPKRTPSASSRAQSPADASRPRSPSAPPSAGETNIHVVVRCRGRSDREVRENSGVVVSTNGVKGKTVELSMGPNAISNKTYHFDNVYSPAADQTIIYEEVVAPILSEMLTGYNCTIFAYGQTGTGKTYTMSGDMTDTLGLLSDAAGVIPRVLYSLFSKIEADQLECSVKCSFIELYNEELRDLISPEENYKLKIYDDASRKSHGATLVQGMEESHIKTASAGIKLLQQGSYRRQVAATKCNDLSSRSHTVFTITTYIKTHNEAGEDLICSGKLNLVDLAGSENIQRSGAENKRAAEAGLINKSLLTLGRVINALVDKSSHIPYRESKLTRLLQDSLGGRTKTCIIATVSPAKSNLEETISTLDYAFRAKNIRNKPQVNSMISKKTLLREFTAEIEKLKSELIATRQRNGVYLTNEQYEEITVESESRRILSDEQRARIETMEASLRNKVQELFNLTNNFQILKRDNEGIKSALESTKTLLSETESVLSNTRYSLADETEVRKAHQKTETELQGIGYSLLSTLGESVDHVGRLHSKIDRHSNLQTQNKQSWQSTVTDATQAADLIVSNLASFESDHSRLATEMKSRVQNFVGNELLQLAATQFAISSRIAGHETSRQRLNGQTIDAKDDMNHALQEIKTLRDDVKSKLGEGLQGLTTAAEIISAEVIGELEQFHTQLHSSYAGLGRDFKSLFEDMTHQLASQRDEITALRQALQDAHGKQLQANQKARDRLHALKEQLEETVADLNGSSSTFQETTNSCNEGLARWLSQDTTLLEKVNTSKEALKVRMKTDWTTVSERNTAIQTSTKAVHAETVKIVEAQLQQTSTQMNALDDVVDRAMSQNVKYHSEHASELEALSSNAHGAFTEIKDHLTTQSTAAETFNKDVALTNLEALVHPFTEDTSRQMTALRTRLQTQSVTDYTPTGETPMKREWSYPITLPRTEPPDPIQSLRLREITPAKPSSRTSPRKQASPRKSPRKSPAKIQIWSGPENSVTRVPTKSGDGGGGVVGPLKGRSPLYRSASEVRRTGKMLDGMG